MSARIALITGGSRGLGRNAALHLARQGTDVIVTYLNKSDEALALVGEIEAMGRKAAALPLDVGKMAALKPFVASLKETLQGKWQRGDIDILVNNAGFGLYASIAETTEEMFDQLMAVHFKGVFFLTQALLPMIRNGGRILNVSTGLARFALPGYAAYAAMKGAVETLTRYLAKELGARGIAVNVIAPGAIATDFGGGHVRDNAELNRYVASQTALGRVGEADDIGAVVASLLREDTGWINAQRIEASGGMFL